MKIATFNANGIRPRTPIILDWLEKNDPDILCVQETKVQDKDFPAAAFEKAGYHVAFRGQKSYNGVAILSREEPSEVIKGFEQNEEKEEARLIAARIGEIHVVNTYIPQGQKVDSEKFEYKLSWFQKLSEFFQGRFNPDTPLVWLGDLNVAPSAIDVYDPDRLYGSVCYHPKEHEALRKTMAFGFTDIYRKHKPEKKAFTFFDYRIPNAVKRELGWRIDHILATAPVAKKSTDAWIDLEPRLLARPSDHTFLVALFDL